MELLHNPSALLWLLAAAALAVVEGMTAGLVCIWFAIGAAAAMIACVLFPITSLVQFGVFVAVSAIALVVMRPLAKRSRQKMPTVEEGVTRNLGRVGTVLSAVTPDYDGRVRLEGVDYAARSTGYNMQPGSLCRVVGMSSTILLVQPSDLPYTPEHPAES